MEENDPIDSITAEYRWCRQQEHLLDDHPGQVVVIHNRMVLGSGLDHNEALEDVRLRAARDNRAVPDNGLLFIVVPEREETLPGSPTPPG